MNMQDLNDMRYFAEVAEQGSFAAAARTLGLLKSRLSRRIAGLEAELGVRLLHRTTRKLSLTPAGEQYLRHCIAIRDQSEQAQAELDQMRLEPRGPLRVVCPVTLAQAVLGPVLPEYLSRYPQIRLEMQVSNRVVNLVEEGVDVALRVRSSLEESGSLIIKRLGLSHGVLVASPALLQAHGVPATPQDLDRYPTVGMSASEGKLRLEMLAEPWLAELHSVQAGSKHVFTSRPLCTTDDLSTLRFVILGGVGMGMLPDYMCQEDLASGRLVRVLPDWSLAPSIVHAVYPSRRGLSPAVRAFLDFLDEKIMHRKSGGVVGMMAS